MGYRAAWMTWDGIVTRHGEAFLHVMDREAPDGPASVLVCDSDDGCVEVWRAALPEGSVVVGVGGSAGVAEHVAGVHVGDPSDRAWLLACLGSAWFDVIHARSSPAATLAALWPYLKPGGVMIVERPEGDAVIARAVEAFLDESGALPPEEVMRITAYPGAMAIEKRNPRVIPYLDAYSGALDPTGLAGGWDEGGSLRVDRATNA